MKVDVQSLVWDLESIFINAKGRSPKLVNMYYANGPQQRSNIIGNQCNHRDWFSNHSHEIH